MNKLNYILVCLFCIVVLGDSCSNHKTQDFSLNIKEYEKVGMPDPNKIWKNYDFVLANISLSSLQETNPFCLPRKDSKKSGILFKRFVAVENLSFLYDTTISLRDRALLVQHFQQLHNQLGNLYNHELKGKPYYNQELIDLHIFRLLVNESKLELAGKIMNSNEENDNSLHAGFSNVQVNYIKLIFMLLDVQMKVNDYQNDDLNRLSTEVSRSLIVNQAWMEPPVKQKLTAKIQNILEARSSTLVKKNYRKVLELIRSK